LRGLQQGCDQVIFGGSKVDIYTIKIKTNIKDKEKLKGMMTINS